MGIVSDACLASDVTTAVPRTREKRKEKRKRKEKKRKRKKEKKKGKKRKEKGHIARLMGCGCYYAVKGTDTRAMVFLPDVTRG